MVTEGVPGQKNVQYKCLTFPKSSQQADSEYVKKNNILLRSEREKIAFLCFLLCNDVWGAY